MNRCSANVLNFILLAATAFFVAGSFWWAKVAGDGLWFARSGSIMVLLAVVVDYRIAKLQQAKNTSAMGVSTISGVPVSGNLGRFEQTLATSAHVFAIAGTIIWGYGDLVI